MTDTGLSLPFGPAASGEAPDLRVTLDAETGPENAYSPTLADIDAMMAQAASGLSARHYQLDQCPAAVIGADGTVTVILAALVWPSLPGLRYRLDLPEEAWPGDVTEHRAERRHRIWTDGRQVHELPWRLEDASFEWHPRLLPRDARGALTSPPAVVLDQARVIIAAPVYGLLTVTGTAVGFRHEVELDFAKFDEDGAPRKVELEAVPVTAVWTGADGAEESAEADLPVPACVSGLLETCEEGGEAVFGFHSRRKRRYRVIHEVAYSTCDGSVLGTRVIREEEGA